MTKEYDDYKSDKRKHKPISVLIKVLGVFVIVGVVLAAVMFFLMLLFPARNGDGWVNLFKSA